jgi:hypothetical protein
MRNSVLIVLLGLALTAGALAAHAQSVKAPAVGTANPAPPAAASDLGQPEPPKPVLGGNTAGKTNGVATDNRAVPPFAGTDTSTAAPGGQAESSANGALSSPPNGQPARKTHHTKKPAESGSETPQDKAR